MELRGAALLLAILGIALCSAIVLTVVQGATVLPTSPSGHKGVNDRALRLCSADLEERITR